MADERGTVQSPLIEYAGQIEWKFVEPKEALRQRQGTGGRFLRDTLEQQLVHLNPGIFNSQRLDEVINRLSRIPHTIEGNREALDWLRGKGAVHIQDQRRDINITLIDYEHLENNIFQVTKEWQQKRSRGIGNIRADAVFLINGIPVAIVETKEPTDQDSIAEGVEQLRRYEQQAPDLYVFAQIFGVTDRLNFYYGVTWETNRKNVFNWKEEESGNFERKVKHFFDQERLLKTLQKYIIFLTKDDVLSKMILRQHQTRAVEKVLKRVLEERKQRGLVWHTQGSGKTLTMLTIAALLLRTTTADQEKPLVLMIVDRNELEQQLLKHLDAYGIGTYKVAQSKADLEKVLSEGYRGLVVSMIHKFGKIQFKNNNVYKRVVILVDEAHRSTGGDLGTDLIDTFPDAKYIGFTGTPTGRASTGMGTFKIFGSEDPGGYLDKYAIDESIRDKTTVELHYTLAPSHLRVDKETLEKEFLSLTENEGVSDIDELNAILDRAVNLRQILKSPDHIQKVAPFVAQHFRETVEPMGFKAFLVAVDREACVKYLQALRPLLPDGWVETVYSTDYQDTGDLKTFAHTEDEEKRIRRDFVHVNKMPKLLIVTEKLLTGYDAPLLYCLYLDKPMRDHVLLQAIARVNRPYENDEGKSKSYGFIMDFIGIFEKLERALAFDAPDVQAIQSVVQHINTLERLFESQWRKHIGEYLPWAQKVKDPANLDEVIAYFWEEQQRRNAFLELFRQLQALYDVLSPSQFLKPYQKQYADLAYLYALIRRDINAAPVDKELTRKTSELLQKYTSSSLIEDPTPIHAFDEQELARLKQSDLPEVIKLVKLRKIIKAIDKEADREPALRPIGERAEAVIKQYEEHRIETQKALAEALDEAEQYARVYEARRASGLDPNPFAIYTVLKPDLPSCTPQQALVIDQIIRRYPDYQWDERQDRELRAELGAHLYWLYCVIQSEEEAIEHSLNMVSRLLKLERV
jgi:type I restriction enzyme R subunit